MSKYINSSRSIRRHNTITYSGMLRVARASTTPWHTIARSHHQPAAAPRSLLFNLVSNEPHHVAPRRLFAASAVVAIGDKRRARLADKRKVKNRIAKLEELAEQLGTPLPKEPYEGEPDSQPKRRRYNRLQELERHVRELRGNSGPVEYKKRPVEAEREDDKEGIFDSDSRPSAKASTSQFTLASVAATNWLGWTLRQHGSLQAIRLFTTSAPCLKPPSKQKRKARIRQKAKEAAAPSKQSAPAAAPPPPDSKPASKAKGPTYKKVAVAAKTKAKVPEQVVDTRPTEVRAGWGPDRLQPPPAVMPVVGVDAGQDLEAVEAADDETTEAAAPFVRSLPPHMVAGPTATKLRAPDETEQYRKIRPQDYTAEAEWPQKAAELAQKSPDKMYKTKTGGRLASKDVPFQPIPPLRKMEIASLEHGLNKVLFNPGVHRLRDPRSGIYNYSETLGEIPDVDLFDYQALPAYITSSKDSELQQLAEQENAQFRGSTSSLTSMLSQIYFLVSGWKPPESKGFGDEFKDEPKGFSMAARLPATIALQPTSNATPGGKTLYAIDQDKSASGELENSNYVLMNLGKAMELMLTSTPEKFSSYLRVNRPPAGSEGEKEDVKEAYHYVKAGDDFVMRSQLDCHHDQLPGKTFDLKTRAVVAVRHDRANWVEASGYQITSLTGLWGSFEREKYDMSRSAWLKYYLQAKIGCMDGIFVAYHNSAKMFGYEYFPIEDMANRIFGSEEMANQAFRLCVGLSERILKRAIELYPGRPIRLTFDTIDRFLENRDPKANPADTMRVWVEPKDIAAPQEGEESGEDAATSQEHKQQQQQQGTTRNLVQFDVSVDRYMWDSLIKGPVDFAAFKGPTEESRDSPPSAEPLSPGRPFDWTLEYMIHPRFDLSEKVVASNLRTVRKRMEALIPLVLPNIDAVNERERRLEAELKKNPEALQRYKEEKASGIAMGMPSAPGQIDLFSLNRPDVDHAGLRAEVEAEELKRQRVESQGYKEAKESTTSSPSETTTTNQAPLMQRAQGIWRKANAQIMELRGLARGGAKQAASDEKRYDQQEKERESKKKDK